MNAKKDNTEEKILDAAKNIFIKKGMDGARMQEIADAAGINKALLHYYFRSKDKLFDAIFSRILSFAFPKIGQILQADQPFLLKVEQVIDTYLDLLYKHPYLPAFILKEVNRDPSMFFKLVLKHGFSPAPIFEIIEEAMDRKEIIRMNPKHLVVHVLSMCIFPFAAKPVINFVLFNEDKQATQDFFEERKQEVKQFVLRAISPL
ncbi:helix-turn-helix domain-containing protein [uncultured Sunxiuqinia sp.]|jgi:TetR/AcrR family transcriptional regulator|uniref:TetR/AcrR family transcriptional regulator n=1 Tax=uncultured Sunxiuqinia sp. TaxID=1573825 RepID=UPI001985635D|nr:TetR/AcrR family transcriptional regulator [Sunxiuqinia sp.]|tara:strand:- start:3627 stop:4238 length:612 start_codon:yes stop_codon:yes gene_type:complete